MRLKKKKVLVKSRRETMLGKRPSIVSIVFLLGTLGALTLLLNPSQKVRAQAPAAPGQAAKPPAPVIDSLKNVTIPTPVNLKFFVQNPNAAIALGKALFWDQAVGSDGLDGSGKPVGQACASCHFVAGADSRSKSQVNPGFRAVPQDTTFTPPFGRGYQLTGAAFPFFRLANPNDPNSAVQFDTNDIASSMGVNGHSFGNIVPGNVADTIGNPDNFVDAGPSPGVFSHTAFREVEPRNTPTTIGAAFNFRNFWDGRARNEFNGVNPIGDLDPTARVLLSCTTSDQQAENNAGLTGQCSRNSVAVLQQVQLNGNLSLENSSLASQALGPPLSNLQMSFDARTFPKLGKKMLSLSKALPNQRVASTDSALGPYAVAAPGKGLNVAYPYLIQQAFKNWWWDSPQTITDSTGTYTQMEYNFSLFFGIAIQMYETTLVPDDTPFDRFMNGTHGTNGNDGTGTLGPSQLRGLDLFTGQGRCSACHGGPELTNASIQNVNAEKLERMLMGNDFPAVYDNGFYNTGLTRCGSKGFPAAPCDDFGIGATIGPLNLPLSMSRFFQLPQNCNFGTGIINGQTFSGCLGAPLIAERPLEGIPFNLLQPNERVAVDGAFKTPGLRNVELTAPYFHNGGSMTLMDTVEFYNRGGNFGRGARNDNQDNFDPNVVPLGLTCQQRLDLVDFLIALTDERVRFQKGPFDHPEINIPEFGPTVAGTQNFGLLPAVGKGGSAAPLPKFPKTPGNGLAANNPKASSPSGTVCTP